MYPLPKLAYLIYLLEVYGARRYFLSEHNLTNLQQSVRNNVYLYRLADNETEVLIPVIWPNSPIERAIENSRKPKPSDEEIDAAITKLTTYFHQLLTTTNEEDVHEPDLENLFATEEAREP